MEETAIPILELGIVFLAAAVLGFGAVIQASFVMQPEAFQDGGDMIPRLTVQSGRAVGGANGGMEGGRLAAGRGD